MRPPRWRPAAHGLGEGCQRSASRAPETSDGLGTPACCRGGDVGGPACCWLLHPGGPCCEPAPAAAILWIMTLLPLLPGRRAVHRLQLACLAIPLAMLVLRRGGGPRIGVPDRGLGVARRRHRNSGSARAGRQPRRVHVRRACGVAGMRRNVNWLRLTRDALYIAGILFAVTTWLLRGRWQPFRRARLLGRRPPGSIRTSAGP